MGSGFYTLEEAMQRLGRGRRSVFDYAKKGFIKRQVRAGRHVFDRESVDLLAVDLGADSPALTRRAFLQLETRTKKLEDEMRMVKHILEIRDVQPLRPNQTTCEGIILACKTYLASTTREEHWTQALMEQWLGIFESMDEVTLDSLSKASNDPQAWVPFFKFCSEMADFAWAQDQKTPSLVWQALGTKLETARKHLRSVVVTWLEMGKGLIPSDLMLALEAPKASLMARVAKDA